MPENKPKAAVFLDRDGTLNMDKGYVWRKSDWEWLPGSLDAIVRLYETGLKLVVITNQSGIVKGMYREEDVMALHQFINQELASHGAAIEAFYFCPHHPDFGGACDCRKPSPTLIRRAAKDLNLDLASSFMVGDKLLDIQAGLSAGTRSILVRTGYGQTEESKVPHYVPVVDNLSAAAKLILNIIGPSTAKA